jgi:NADH:ubiquinone oxidoreductase subunit H
MTLTCLFNIKTTSIGSIIFGLKFIIFIAVLIFVRGGIPRYRYDFLTKLGWVKTLSLILIILFLTLLMIYIN